MFQLHLEHCVPTTFRTLCSNYIYNTVFQLHLEHCVPTTFTTLCSNYIYNTVFQLHLQHCVPTTFTTLCSNYIYNTVFQLQLQHCVPRNTQCLKKNVIKKILLLAYLPYFWIVTEKKHFIGPTCFYFVNFRRPPVGDITDQPGTLFRRIPYCTVMK